MRRPLTSEGKRDLKSLKMRCGFTATIGTAIAIIAAISDFGESGLMAVISFGAFWLGMLVLILLLFCVGYVTIKIIDSRRAPPTDEEIETARRMLYGDKEQ